MKNRNALILFTVFFFTILVGTILFFRLRSNTKASEHVSVNTAQLTNQKAVTGNSNVSYFSLYGNNQPIHKGTLSGLEAANEILRKNVSVNTSVSGLVPTANDILPPDFLQNAELIKSTKDSDDPFLKKNNIKSNKEHYYYRQKINGVPVYGSGVMIHVQNGNEIYAIAGTVISNTKLEKEAVSEETIKEKALAAAAEHFKADSSDVTILKHEKVIFNKSMFGSDDSKNFPALQILVTRKQTDDIEYVISLTDGIVLRETQTAHTSINRTAINCRGTAESANCPVVRTEGSPPSGNTIYDTDFNTLGTVANYWRDTFGREGYSGNGVMKYAYQDMNSSATCAIDGSIRGYWHDSLQTVNSCWPEAMRIQVMGHEVTHGMVGNMVPGLTTSKLQNGSVSEGTAEIMAAGLFDEDNVGDQMFRFDELIKSYGTNINMGTYRVRLFDSDDEHNGGYLCNEAGWGFTMAHNNGFIIQSGFSLMAFGTSRGYNGCIVHPLGKLKASKIWFRMLSTYLTTTPNFRTVYDGARQACADLHGAGSHECLQVTNALKAVEIDQQPVGELRGAMCIGIQPQKPTCTAQPTAIPTYKPTEFALSVSPNALNMKVGDSTVVTGTLTKSGAPYELAVFESLYWKELGPVTGIFSSSVLIENGTVFRNKFTIKALKAGTTKIYAHAIRSTDVFMAEAIIPITVTATASSPTPSTGPGGSPPTANAIGPSNYSIGASTTIGLNATDPDSDFEDSYLYVMRADAPDKASPLPASARIVFFPPCNLSTNGTCSYTQPGPIQDITANGQYVLFAIVTDKAGHKCSGNPYMTPGAQGYTPCGAASGTFNQGGFVLITATGGPSITPSGCTKKTQGDADCNGTISVTDYAVWRLEYKGACSSTNLNATACGDDKDVDGSLMDADFSEDDKVSLVDYQIWRTSIGSGV